MNSTPRLLLKGDLVVVVVVMPTAAAFQLEQAGFWPVQILFGILVLSISSFPSLKHLPNRGCLDIRMQCVFLFPGRDVEAKAVMFCHRVSQMGIFKPDA